MKIEKTVFKILLILLPVQLGYHFWPQWSLVWGIRVDYLSPVVYLTDLLMVTLLILWLIRKGWQEVKVDQQKKIIFLAVFLLAVGNITLAQVWQVAFFSWLKIVEVLFLGFWLFTHFKEIKDSLIKLLSVSVIYTTIIALGQFILQRSLGGYWYLLGERTFHSNTPGIALADFFGKSFLRPYSIFSHPNSYAGFVLLTLGIILALGYQKPLGQLAKLAVLLGVIGVILSFSQAAWLVLVLGGGLWFLVKRKPHWDWTQVYLIVFGMSLYFSFVTAFLGSQLLQHSFEFPQTVARRLELATLAGYLFSQKPFWGVGLGNFIVVLPSLYQEIFWGTGRLVYWWLQPVHNIFLLTLSQVGFLGWGFLVYVFGKTAQKVKGNPLFLLPLIVILLTGAVDHYWLTLPQNSFLLGVFFAIIWAWEK